MKIEGNWSALRRGFGGASRNANPPFATGSPLWRESTAEYKERASSSLCMSMYTRASATCASKKSSILDGREQVRRSLLETTLTIKTKTLDEIRGRSVLGRRLQSPIDFPGSVLAISSSEKTEREVVPELQ